MIGTASGKASGKASGEAMAAANAAAAPRRERAWRGGAEGRTLNQWRLDCEFPHDLVKVITGNAPGIDNRLAHFVVEVPEHLHEVHGVDNALSVRVPGLKGAPEWCLARGAELRHAG